MCFVKVKKSKILRAPLDPTVFPTPSGSPCPRPQRGPHPAQVVGSLSGTVADTLDCMPTARKQQKEKLTPRDFGCLGAACLFVGGGQAGFLSYMHAWFYGFFSTGFAIFLISVSVIFLLAATSGSWAHRPQSAKRRLSLWAVLLAWAGIAYLYMTGPAFSELVRESQLARAYREDPSCDPAKLRDLAKRGHDSKNEATVTNAASDAICILGWAKVAGKAAYHSCLLLQGPGLTGEYCGGFRHRPNNLDWNNIHVGDSLVAQTAYGRPSYYLYQSEVDVTGLVSAGRVFFQPNSSPEWQYGAHFANAFVFLSIYLALGAAALFASLGDQHRLR